MLYLAHAFTGASICGLYTTMEGAKQALQDHATAMGCTHALQWVEVGACYRAQPCCGAMEGVWVEPVELGAPMPFA